VCLSFYVLSLLIVKKFRAWPITAVAPVELDEIDHSSSEKKSFSSYWPFSRSETKVKGSAVLRSKTALLAKPLTARRSGGYLRWLRLDGHECCLNNEQH
jgi:hypothetical protein